MFGALFVTAALAAAGAAGAPSQPRPRLVLYSFSGRLLARPVAAANSLSLKVERGNARALRKLAAQSSNQSFAVGPATRYRKRQKRGWKTVSLRALRIGDWLTIRIWAPPRATLARIQATPARLVLDYGQRGRFRDATPPVITPVVAGIPGANGWFVSDVTVRWTVDDGESGIASRSGCASVLLTQETVGAPLSCSARNGAGLSNSSSIAVRIDKTPPTVAAAPARPPDRNGWYNHPVSVAFFGVDATSGIDACTSARYGGPDSEAATVSGSCTDRAGHTASISFTLKYDATPTRRVRKVTVTAGYRAATLGWQPPPDPDFAHVRVTRSRVSGAARAVVVYEGARRSVRDRGLTIGVRYRYALVAVDRAGNRSQAVAAIVVPTYLLAPRDAARVTSPPVLRWARPRKASYFNVQLYRRGRKVLSAWPSRPRLALRGRWTYRGRRYRLGPGRYRWYVWPGLGPRSRARYGKLLGQRSFVVVRKRAQ